MAKLSQKVPLSKNKAIHTPNQINLPVVHHQQSTSIIKQRIES